MAAFPTVKHDWAELGDDQQSVVERAEMERGLAKQRRINSDALVTVMMTVHFDTLAEALAFLAWYNTDINAGQDFFDFTDPLTSAAVQGRIPKGGLGKLQYQQNTLQASKRTVKIEFLRPAY
jgi:hypothetical protein